jgi:RNA recognition motif-containing protein
MAGTYTPVSPVVSSDGYFQPRVPTYEAPPTQFVAPPTPQYYTHPPSVVFAGNIPPSTPVYVPQQQVLSYIVPQIPFATAPAPAPNLVVPFQPANPGSSSIVKTEARKIIITQLPHNISKSELCYMLEKAGFESRSTSQRNHVQEIELARHSDGASKRHAFVVLESHHYAKRAVEALNGIKFQGRKLQLRLAKEGAEPSQRRSPPAQSSGYHVSRTASPHMLPLSASMGNLTIRTESNSTGSNHGVTEEHVATRNARSSGSKGSSKSTKDEGKKERESSRKYDSQSGGSDASATPVVVDGSSCAKKQRKHH